ncbi:hypothetical protein H9I45_15185 [Polaribacter haliotis]|uniref:Uncharacterized protein n=1 Tax=Polaribacter haliotis TaxID=1888915 RepID=A0A7L8AF67_9FLAO|nr:hypothetical protein [Polaribacter haliotis]QOD60663.1 hypothetical protein H9I45_15185 [Polaribacter haliotis]
MKKISNVKVNVIKYCKLFYGIELKYSVVRIVTIASLVYTLTNLRTDNIAKSVEIAELKAENDNLKDNVIYNYLEFEDSPIETWSKKVIRRNGKLRFVGNYFNLSYEKQWGHYFDYDRNNLLGKDNFSLGYPNDIAWSYWRNDSLVYEILRRRKDTSNFKQIEHAKDSLGIMKYFETLKYPINRRKDTFIVGKILKYYD